MDERDHAQTRSERPGALESFAHVQTAPAPRTPEQLGRYRVLYEIARGGMGVVYAARLVGDHGFGRLVALKRLNILEATDQDVQAFFNEARLTARIRHPNVVETWELGVDDGWPFIAMQLVEGVSLARLLSRFQKTEQRLDPALAIWIVAQAAAGLHAAHDLTGDDGEALGVVHRDVSPENILLSSAGRVLVADFGIAKLLDADRATKKGVLKGKFAYMAPEHVRGEALDRRADVFALGIVLWESLVGRRLFAGASAADTIRRVMDEIAPDPREQRPEIPAGVTQILAACLEKDPTKRMGSAGELSDALRQLLRDVRQPVDEGDLAAVVRASFGEELAATAAQIRSKSEAVEEEAATAAVPRAPGLPNIGYSERPPATSSEDVFDATTNLALPSEEEEEDAPLGAPPFDEASLLPELPSLTGEATRSFYARAIAIGVTAALIGVGGALLWMRPPRRPPLSISAATAHSLTPAASSTAPIVVATTASVEPPVTPASSATTAATSKPLTGPKPKSSVASAESSKPLTPPTLAPTSSSKPTSKGIPFPSLGP
jgi:serine/threonine-protein kinase